MNEEGKELTVEFLMNQLAIEDCNAQHKSLSQPEHQLGQKCVAKNAKCKECHKIGHFHKVCQSKKRGKRANLVQATNQDENDTHIDENGVRQPNPPVVNMLKLVNHIGATRGSQGKHLKFPIDIDPRGPTSTI